MTSNTSGSGIGPSPREALMAFDALPAELRQRLANATVQVDPTDLWEWYRRAKGTGALHGAILSMAEEAIRGVEAEAASVIEAERQADLARERARKPKLQIGGAQVRR